MADKGDILIDVVDEDYGAFAQSFIEKAGHTATVCSGPTRTHPCPVLQGNHCEHLEGAAGVVFQFDLDDPIYRRLLEVYKDSVPSHLPLRVVVSEEQQKKYANLLRGVDVWVKEPSISELDGFSAEVESASQSE